MRGKYNLNTEFIYTVTSCHFKLQLVSKKIYTGIGNKEHQET